MTDTDLFPAKGAELPRQEKTSSVIHGSGGQPTLDCFGSPHPTLKKDLFWAGQNGKQRQTDLCGLEVLEPPQRCRSRWLGIIRVPGTELCSLNEKDEFLSTEVSLGVFWGVGGLVVLRLCSCTAGWPQTHHVTRDDPSVSIFQVMG